MVAGELQADGAVQFHLHQRCLELVPGYQAKTHNALSNHINELRQFGRALHRRAHELHADDAGTNDVHLDVLVADDVLWQSTDPKPPLTRDDAGARKFIKNLMQLKGSWPKATQRAKDHTSRGGPAKVQRRAASSSSSGVPDSAGVSTIAEEGVDEFAIAGLMVVVRELKREMPRLRRDLDAALKRITQLEAGGEEQQEDDDDDFE